MPVNQAFVKKLKAEAKLIRKVSVLGVEYDYYLMSKDLNPSLRFFCGAPSSEAIFISEDVPEKFRAVVLTHEILCNIVPTETCGADLCVQCSKAEVALIEPNQLGEYCQMRISFYEDLIPYLTRTDDYREANHTVLAKVEASLAFLKALRS